MEEVNENIMNMVIQAANEHNKPDEYLAYLSQKIHTHIRKIEHDKFESRFSQQLTEIKGTLAEGVRKQIDRKMMEMEHQINRKMMKIERVLDGKNMEMALVLDEKVIGLREYLKRIFEFVELYECWKTNQMHNAVVDAHFILLKMVLVLPERLHAVSFFSAPSFSTLRLTSN
ncbi:MAG: hypothetical protein Q9195_005046 [Heterodermia aff. obscurata]